MLPHSSLPGSFSREKLPQTRVLGGRRIQRSVELRERSCVQLKIPLVEKYSCRFTGCCVQNELRTVLPGSCSGSIDERASLFLDADIDGSCPRGGCTGCHGLLPMRRPCRNVDVRTLASCIHDVNTPSIGPVADIVQSGLFT